MRIGNRIQRLLIEKMKKKPFVYSLSHYFSSAIWKDTIGFVTTPFTLIRFRYKIAFGVSY